MTHDDDTTHELSDGEIVRVARVILDTLKCEKGLDNRIAVASLMRCIIAIMPSIRCPACARAVYGTALQALAASAAATTRASKHVH